MKFTPAGGRVEVVAEAGGGSVRIRVTDTGEGFDPAFLRAMFQPFSQEDVTRIRLHGGLGLGLMIVQLLVEAHGGHPATGCSSALTGAGVTVMMTIEITENYTELRFSPHAVSFMTHDIILQRYLELKSELKTVITVVKTRGRAHKRELRSYEVTRNGVVVGEVLRGYEGLITGVPRPVNNAAGASGDSGSQAQALPPRRNAKRRTRVGCAVGLAFMRHRRS